MDAIFMDALNVIQILIRNILKHVREKQYYDMKAILLKLCGSVNGIILKTHYLINQR